MKILFITRMAWPHIGGVEKHVGEVTKVLKKKGNSVKIISEDDIKYPHIKYLGLLFVWIWLLKSIKVIKDADIIHIHDVFIWYLPFRFIFPNKKVFTTVHGLEWDSPLSKISLWQKRLAVRLSTKTIGVGDFLEKYLKVKFDRVIYGATTLIHINVVKKRNSVVYVGRLEENTGLLQFLKWLDSQTVKRPSVDFCGDGRLRKECEKYGTVHGFTDPNPFLKKADYCVPGGYLAALEGLSYNCKLKLFWSNKVKEDYWKMSPFYKLKGKKLKDWAKKQTWEKVAGEYLDLYKHAA